MNKKIKTSIFILMLLAISLGLLIAFDTDASVKKTTDSKLGNGYNNLVALNTDVENFACGIYGSQKLTLSMLGKYGEFENNNFQDTTYRKTYYGTNPSKNVASEGCINVNQLIELEKMSSHDKARAAIAVANVAGATNDNRADAISIFNCTNLIGASCSTETELGLKLKTIGNDIYDKYNKVEDKTSLFKCADGICTVGKNEVSKNAIDLVVVGYSNFLNDYSLIKSQYSLTLKSSKVSSDNKFLELEVVLKDESNPSRPFSDFKSVEFFVNDKDLAEKATLISNDDKEKVYSFNTSYVVIRDGNLCNQVTINARILENKVKSIYEVTSISSDTQKLYNLTSYETMPKMEISNKANVEIKSSPLCKTSLNNEEEINRITIDEYENKDNLVALTYDRYSVKTNKITIDDVNDKYNSLIGAKYYKKSFPYYGPYMEDNDSATCCKFTDPIVVKTKNPFQCFPSSQKYYRVTCPVIDGVRWHYYEYWYCRSTQIEKASKLIGNTVQYSIWRKGSCSTSEVASYAGIDYAEWVVQDTEYKAFVKTRTANMILERWEVTTCTYTRNPNCPSPPPPDPIVEKHCFSAVNTTTYLEDYKSGSMTATDFANKCCEESNALTQIGADTYNTICKGCYDSVGSIPTHYDDYKKTKDKDKFVDTYKCCEPDEAFSILKKDDNQSVCCYDGGNNSLYNRYQIYDPNYSRTEFQEDCCGNSESPTQLGADKFKELCINRTCFTFDTEDAPYVILESYKKLWEDKKISNETYGNVCCSYPEANSDEGMGTDVYKIICKPPVPNKGCFESDAPLKTYFEEFLNGDLSSNAFTIAHSCCDPSKNPEEYMGVLYNKYCDPKPACDNEALPMSCSTDSSHAYIYEGLEKGITDTNYKCLTGTYDSTQDSQKVIDPNTGVITYSYIDKTNENNNDFMVDDLDETPFCAVYCKEDVDLYYQGFGYNPITDYQIKSGQYFTYKAYNDGTLEYKDLPTINQQRSCLYKADVGALTKNLYGKYVDINDINTINSNNIEGGLYQRAIDAITKYYEYNIELDSWKRELYLANADTYCPPGDAACVARKSARVDRAEAGIAETEADINETKEAYEYYVSYMKNLIGQYNTCLNYQNTYTDSDYPNAENYEYDEQKKPNTPDVIQSILDDIELEEKHKATQNPIQIDFCKEDANKLNCNQANETVSRKLPLLKDTLEGISSAQVFTYISSHKVDSATETMFFEYAKSEASNEIDYVVGAELYALKPSGAAVNEDHELFTQDIKDRHAYNYIGFGLPINLTTRAGKYEYNFDLTNLGKTNRLLPSFKFVHDIPESELYAEYSCIYAVSNEIVCPRTSCTICPPDESPSPDCSFSDGGEIPDPTLQPFARRIDNENVNPNDRELGINWKDAKGLAALEKITTDGEEIYLEEPMYSFILTRDAIVKIREYNVTNSYSDFNLTCNDDGYDCTSEFIDQFATQENLEATRQKWIIYDFETGTFIEKETTPVYTPEQIQQLSTDKTQYQFTYGDVNQDNKIDVLDKDAIIDHLSGKINLTLEQRRAADVNLNDIVDLNDANLILRKINNNSLYLPVNVLFGDINDDGEIDATDLTLLTQHIKKTKIITDPIALSAADINLDGKIDSLDEEELKKKIANIIPEVKQQLMYGDVNFDKKISMRDIMAILSYTLGEVKFSYDQFVVSDVNLNDKTELNDARLILYSYLDDNPALLPKKIIFGDVNNDMKINTTDLFLIIRHMVNNYSINKPTGNLSSILKTPYQLSAADYTLDGEIQIVDLESIMKNNRIYLADVNLDQKINQTDLGLLNKFISINKTKTATSYQNPYSINISAADINLDKKIDYLDRDLLEKLLKTSVNLTTNLVYGDVNQDNLVDIMDISLFTSYLLNEVKFTDNQLKAADVNLNGKADANDMKLIVFKIVDGIHLPIKVNFGDANQDGVVNITDLNLMVDHILEVDESLNKGFTITSKLTNVNRLAAADANYDGEIDIRDLVVIINKLGLIEGDINLDKTVTNADLTMLENHISNKQLITNPNSLYLADVNHDKKIDKLDIAALLKLIKNPPIIYKIGDVNRDGEIGMRDGLTIIYYLNNSIDLDEEQLKLADTNLNNKVDGNDSLMILINYLNDGEFKLPQKINHGDVNSDGKMDVKDVQLMVDHILQTNLLTNYSLAAADFNLDAQIDISDVVLLIDKIDIIYGDVNLDGNVDVGDLVHYVDHLNGTKSMELLIMQLADVNLNNKIDQNDMAIVAEKILNPDLILPIKVLFGDVNLDGKIDSLDAQLLLKQINDSSTLKDPKQLWAADINLDTKINIMDLAILGQLVTNSNYKMGDTNLDGEIDILDLTLIISYIQEDKYLSKEQLYVSDVNFDGKVDTNDLTLIIDMIVA